MERTVAWWEDYFDELYVRMFEAMLAPERTHQELSGLTALLDLAPGSRVLDLACGQGRHAIPLAHLGHHVVGIDRSAYMLQRAQSTAATGTAGGRRPVDGIEWVCGDMRHLPFGTHPWSGDGFDACINLFTSFGYFEEEAQNEQVIAEVTRVLRPGARFLIDVSNRDHYLLRAWPSSWRHYGSATILEQTTFDPETCRFRNTFTWVEGDRRESLVHSVRHYTAPELKGMLRRAGLEPLGVYGDFDARPLTLDSERMIILAQKTKE